MDILLTQSYLIERDPPEKRIMRPYPPLGIMYVASFLKETGIKVALLDNTFETDLNKFENSIRQMKPLLVGISAVETTRKTAFEMCQIARNMDCRVVVGGPDPVNCLDSYFDSGAEWVCEGEGEVTLYELIHALKEESKAADNISGLYYRYGSSMKYTGKRDLISDINSIPIAAWDMIPVDEYLDNWCRYHGETSIPMISSRGCPHSCTWCSRTVFGRTFRRRSPDNFVNEICHLKETINPDYFWFADDSFASSSDWLRKFKTEKDNKNLQIEFECLGRVDEIQYDTANLLKETGCRLIWFGAESGSQRVLDSMRKAITVDEIFRARDIMSQCGIPVGFFIMLGYPPETIGDVFETVNLIKKAKPDKIGVSVAYPIAGTEFYEQALSGVKDSQWTCSGENKTVFHTHYPSAFYWFARKLIHKESQLARKADSVSFSDYIKASVYRYGMNVYSIVGKER